MPEQIWRLTPIVVLAKHRPAQRDSRCPDHCVLVGIVQWVALWKDLIGISLAGFPVNNPNTQTPPKRCEVMLNSVMATHPFRRLCTRSLARLAVRTTSARTRGHRPPLCALQSGKPAAASGLRCVAWPRTPTQVPPPPAPDAFVQDALCQQSYWMCFRLPLTAGSLCWNGVGPRGFVHLCNTDRCVGYLFAPRRCVAQSAFPPPTLIPL